MLYLLLGVFGIFGLAAAQYTNGTRHCDVVIIGGGSSGSHSAIFLQDNGYDVCIIEKTYRLGGHCDTIYTNTTPDWTDIGVQIFRNTSWNNANGFGTYNLDMATYISRFTPIISLPAIGTTTGQSADLNHGIGLNPGITFSATDLRTLATTLNAMYPFLDDVRYPHGYPDNIPTELTQSFKHYVDTHPFIQPFTDYFMQTVITGAVGSVNKAPALYALKELSPAFIMLSVEPNVAFVMIEGCQAVYNGIEAELTNITFPHLYFNATITDVDRPGGSAVSTVTFTIDGVEHEVFGDKIIVAIEPTLDNLSPFDLDHDEFELFRYVKVNSGFFDALFSVDTGIPFTYFQNYANTHNFKEPSYPSMLSISSGFAPGYAGGAIFSEDPDFTVAAATAVLEADIVKLDLLPNPITNVTLLEVRKHYGYMGQFTGSVLRSHDPYKKLRLLQGHLNTYYVGALTAFADTSYIAEYAYDLVNYHFPA